MLVIIITMLILVKILRFQFHFSKTYKSSAAWTWSIVPATVANLPLKPSKPTVMD